MKEALEKAAWVVRKAFENSKTEFEQCGCRMFAGFPDGCCEYASLLLGHYLIHNSICKETQLETPPQNLSNSEGEGHAWLRVDGKWHVDITCDQFSSVSQKVIVSTDNKLFFSFDFTEWEWDAFPIMEKFVFDTLLPNHPEGWRVACKALEIPLVSPSKPR